ESYADTGHGLRYIVATLLRPAWLPRAPWTAPNFAFAGCWRSLCSMAGRYAPWPVKCDIEVAQPVTQSEPRPYWAEAANSKLRMKQTATGHEQFGAWREGEHDDLVFAVALAHWGARKVYPRRPDGDDGYWVMEGGQLRGGVAEARLR